MFKNSPLDKSRIDLYLDILNKEHKKKKESKCLEKTTSSVLSAESISLVIKIEKRLLKMWRYIYLPVSLNFKKDGQKIGGEPWWLLIKTDRKALK